MRRNSFSSIGTTFYLGVDLEEISFDCCLWLLCRSIPVWPLLNSDRRGELRDPRAAPQVERRAPAWRRSSRSGQGTSDGAEDVKTLEKLSRDGR
jgi:hypothetical protein